MDAGKFVIAPVHLADFVAHDELIKHRIPLLNQLRHQPFPQRLCRGLRLPRMLIHQTLIKHLLHPNQLPLLMERQIIHVDGVPPVRGKQ